MIRQDWKTISSLWPVLFKCQHFEKPTIQDLLDKIFVKTNKDFDSFENRIKLGDRVFNLALDMAQTSGVDTSAYTTSETARLAKFNERCVNETRIIAGLMSQLIHIAKEPGLLWKNQATSFGSVLFLLNSCEVEKSLLSEECIQLYVDSLIHENINIRKISIDALCIILKMVKHKKQTRRFEMKDLLKMQGVEMGNLSKFCFQSIQKLVIKIVISFKFMALQIVRQSQATVLTTTGTYMTQTF